MIKPLNFLFVAGTLLFIVSGLQAEVRDWTRVSDGKKITAEFVAMKDATTVTIKTAAGQAFDVPLASLSPEDNAYAKEAAAKMAGGATPAAPAGPKPVVPEGETTVILAGVHVCCGDCVDAVAKIGLDEKNPIPAGVVISADRKTEAITIKAPSGKDAKAALGAVLAAGFYGTSDNPAIGIAELKPDDFTTDTMVVRGTHLCCGGCVKAFSKAVESAAGVESCAAKEGAVSVKVEGKGFKPHEVMTALREAGFGGSFQ